MTCMYVRMYVHHLCAVPTESRRRCPGTGFLELALHMVVGHTMCWELNEPRSSARADSVSLRVIPPAPRLLSENSETHLETADLYWSPTRTMGSVQTMANPYAYTASHARHCSDSDLLEFPCGSMNLDSAWFLPSPEISLLHPLHLFCGTGD